jgi:putative ABC transport system permease protein
MSVGQGAQNLILGQVQGLGSRTIAVIPGREPKGPTDIAQTLTTTLKEKDLAALLRKENAPTIHEIMPVVFSSGTASYEAETFSITILGVSEKAFQIFNLDVAEGITFTEEDIKSQADGIVIGSKVRTELFGASDAVGQKIKIKGKNFRVIGVLPQKGQVSFFNFDEIALIPYTTTQQYILGIRYFNRFIVEADSDENIAQTVSDIKRTLRETHEISDPTKDDFFVQTSSDIANTLGTITSVLTLLLTSIAAISLVVGGIGIMNIMLVSVTERTREIGLRKAIGATGKNILTQFLLEAVILTAVGGIIGIILGAGLSFAISIILSNVLGLSWKFVFPFSAAVIGLSVSAIIGLIFGIYPARQASLKSPIEALRYE